MKVEQTIVAEVECGEGADTNEALQNALQEAFTTLSNVLRFAERGTSGFQQTIGGWEQKGELPLRADISATYGISNNGLTDIAIAKIAVGQPRSVLR